MRGRSELGGLGLDSFGERVLGARAVSLGDLVVGLAFLRWVTGFGVEGEDGWWMEKGRRREEEKIRAGCELFAKRGSVSFILLLFIVGEAEWSRSGGSECAGG